jgi:SAM-dependent methyltransferase
MEQFAKGQVVRSAAEVYEEFFVPALFGQWAGPIVDAAGVKPGDAILDVACGTGVVAREAANRLGETGRVVGLDCNDGMLAVARRIAPNVDWRLGQAEALPFEDETFDAATCQFALMFFEDRIAALKEMWRVLKPGGRLAIATWDRLEHSPGYAAMVALLQRLFGTRAADALRAPFVIGEPELLIALAGEAGIPKAAVETRDGTVSFPSLKAWVHTDVKGWTLADMIDDAQFQTLLEAAHRDLTRFAQADSTVSFAGPAHILTAVKG